MKVVCLKWGDKYGPEYVNILQAMVERNLTIPHQFVCITDDPKGIHCYTEQIEPNLEGWWGKISLFKDEPYNIKEKFLFLDLDVVIVDNINCFATGEDFTIIKDWNIPQYSSGIPAYNSSVMLIKPGSHTQIYEQFMLDPRGAKNMTPGGDQVFIAHHARADLWPQDWCVSYKGCQSNQTCIKGPTGKIVVFHGRPNPHECDNWVNDYWHE